MCALTCGAFAAAGSLREDDPQPPARLAEVRLGGPIDHLVVNPQEGVASVGRSRGGREGELTVAEPGSERGFRNPLPS